MPRDNRAYLREQVELHKRLSRVYAEERYGPAYSRLYQHHWNERLCGLLAMPPGARVLDFGCGSGILFPSLRARGWWSVGLDLSPDMLAAAPPGERETMRVCADGCRTPFADESFDAVVCRGSIHHLPNLEQALAEIARLLKPGGCLAFSEPSNDSPINRGARRLLYRHSDAFHEEDEGFRRAIIEPMLKRCGFTLETSRGFGFLAYTFAGFPDKIGLLGYLPGNRLLTRLLIAIDRFLEGLPGIRSLALHWQVRARKATRTP